MPTGTEVVFYVSLVLVVLSLVVSLFIVILYAFIRKFSDNPYNLVVSSLIISEIVMSIHVLIAVIFKDRDYDIVCQIDGVISFFTYNTGAMYFWALSHLISRLDTEKNPAGITTEFYHIWAVAYGAISAIFALACGDIEPSPAGTCAIEGGSISDLFPIIIIFLILPYSLITFLKVLINRKSGLKKFVVVKLNTHALNILAFFVGWIPITFVHVYTFLAKEYPSNLTIEICFMLYCASGLMTSLLRLPADQTLKNAACAVLSCRYRKRSLSMMSRKTSSMQFVRTGKSVAVLRDMGLADLGGGEPSSHYKSEFQHQMVELLDDFTIKNQLRIYNQNVITLSSAFLIMKDTYIAYSDSPSLKRVVDYAQVDERMVLQRNSKHFNIRQELRDDPLVVHGNATLPPFEKHLICKVKEYSPLLFHKIRLMNGLTLQSLHHSLLPAYNEATLEKGYEKTSAKGGQSILKTQNKKLLMKSLRKSEKNFLVLKLLQRLYQHLEDHNNSLLVRFYGVFRVDSTIVKRQFQLLMENLDQISDKLILFKYDLKFSEANRQVLAQTDLNDFIKYKALLSQSLAELLLKTYEVDRSRESNTSLSRFKSFAQNHVLNSSNQSSRTLKKKSVGDAITSPPIGQRGQLSIFSQQTAFNMEGAVDSSSAVRFSRISELKDVDFKNIHGSLPVCLEDAGKMEDVVRQTKRDAQFLRRCGIMDYSLLLIIVKMPTVGEAQGERSQAKVLKNYQYIEQLDTLLSNYYAVLRSPSKSFIYILGIIDYLQQWDIQKQGEKGIKEYLNPEDRGKYSAIPPREYCVRFQKGIQTIFKAEEMAPIPFKNLRGGVVPEEEMQLVSLP